MPLILRVPMMIKKLGASYTFKRVTKTADTSTPVTAAYGKQTPSSTSVTLMSIVFPPTPTTFSEVIKIIPAGATMVGVVNVILPKDTVIVVGDILVTSEGEYNLIGIIPDPSYKMFVGYKG